MLQVLRSLKQHRLLALITIFIPVYSTFLSGETVLALQFFIFPGLSTLAHHLFSMETPSTPQQARDPIEDIRQSLSTKWALGLPFRPIISSPSLRDKHATDEKIYNYIHFLYYRKSFPERAALDYAIAQFEQEAAIILPQRQSEPQAEARVIQSRKRSSFGRDFLQRRDELDEDASRELVLRLEQILRRVAGNVKLGRPFQDSDGMKTRSMTKKSTSGSITLLCSSHTDTS